MKPTDNEKREILKLIEADKPRKPKPLMDANRGKAFAQKSGWELPNEAAA